MPSSALIISITLWLIILAFLWAGLKSGLGKKYTDEELLLPQPKHQPDSFPAWYGYIHALILFCFFAFFIFALFYFPNIIIYLQRLLYYKPDMTFFLAPNTPLISMLPSLFVGMVVYGVVIKFLLGLFPRLDEYQALRDRITFNTQGLSKEQKQEIWQDALQKVDSKKLSLAEWRQILFYGLIIWFIAGLVYVLAMDDYIALKGDKLIVNSFFELKESQYSLSDIKVVKVSPNASQDNDGEYNLTPKFELELNDSKKVDIWGGLGWGSPSAESLIRTADTLHQRKIPFEIDKLDSDLELEALREYDSEAEKTVKTVFEHLQSFNNR